MRYVTLKDEGGATWYNPWPYLEALPSFEEHLPAGARRFALDPDYYDYHSERCVKNLKLVSVVLSDDADAVRFEAGFRYNDLGVADELRIEYRDVANSATND